MRRGTRILLGGSGFAALAVVGGFLLQGQSGPEPTTLTFYIAADEVTWNYAPSGTNQMTGREFTDVEKQWMEAGPTVTGRMAKKAIYREYTDSTFSTLKPVAAQWEHLGMLGPMLRGVVGDTLRIVFRNNASFPASMHPHGVFYGKSSESATLRRRHEWRGQVRRRSVHGWHTCVRLARSRTGWAGGSRGQQRVLDVSFACR